MSKFICLIGNDWAEIEAESYEKAAVAAVENYAEYTDCANRVRLWKIESVKSFSVKPNITYITSEREEIDS